MFLHSPDKKKSCSFNEGFCCHGADVEDCRFGAVRLKTAAVRVPDC